MLKKLRKADPNEPFSGLIFKIMTDPFVGILSFVRVYSGQLKSGSYVYNSTRGTKERVSRLLKMHANKKEEIQELRAGILGLLLGLRMQIRVIRSVMKLTLSYLKKLIFQHRLFQPL